MTSTDKTNEYITFILGEEEYAIEVSRIESILEYTKVTTLPGTDSSIKGVINLRGRALPVVDLRTILRINESDITQDTSIIVMLIDSGDKVGTIGGMVDSVKEVIEIFPDTIQEAPKVGSRIKGDFISGMAQHEDHFIIILDINKILNADQAALAADEDLELPEETEKEELSYQD